MSECNHFGAIRRGRVDALAFAIGVSKAFKTDHTPIVRAGAALDARTGTLTYNAAVGVHF